MADLSRQNIKSRFPWKILAKPYLRDHFFDGKTVFPAVEALMTLASAVKSQHPQATFNYLTDARFPRILAIDAAGDCLDAQIEIEVKACGLCASLLTWGKIKSGAIRRALEHAKVTFVQNKVLPEPTLSFPAAGAMAGGCFHLPAGLIYRELVPFGVSYQNITGDLVISPEGALANISGGGVAGGSLLGSPFVPDAAMHAACVWGQRFSDVVPLPVGFDERIIYAPTQKGESYLARIAPVDISGELLIFNAWIFDRHGAICEQINRLRMRDITQGRMKPPAWMKEGA